MSEVKRIFVEKKNEYNIEAKYLYNDLRNYLSIANLIGLRILIRYDIEGISVSDFEKARKTVFSDPPVDFVYNENIEISDEEYMFAIEYLPGQYDQRADSATQCIQIISQDRNPYVKTARVVILKGELTDNDVRRIKRYLINPVDSREAFLKKPQSLHDKFNIPYKVDTIDGFISMTHSEVGKLIPDLGLAMNLDDLLFCQQYFSNKEKRDPTITELIMLDTYWSDHCRHTTFLTTIEKVSFESSFLTQPVKDAYESYLDSRKFVYEDAEKPICLMDIAVIGMKELKKRGLLDDLEESDEINACSIVVKAELDSGKKEDWLVMFKNETHNHPTEIEPFGGAATCLGGAIRDPLSGRSYVYQAMRVTGCGNPFKSLEETLPGKLPQRKISLESSEGYSSYGNQIGLATGIVTEIYNEGYVAKRMEIGAVVAAAPKKDVIREKPSEGDIILLIGGRTGRDGCGGATGSSKVHTEDSISTCGAEVQKGNPPTERKIQRLFRNPKVSRIIKKCNDFGAGGVSVAIGELADGLHINLDAVPKKYEGLDGTELAISESQERMAVLVDHNDADKFIKYAEEENLEATHVAYVTSDRRIRILWQNKYIVDIERDFVNTHGVAQHTEVEVEAPDETNNFFSQTIPDKQKITDSLEEAWLINLKDLNVCSQKGLVERFDSTVGAASVLHPLGGKYQNTPAESMVAKLPVLKGDTSTGTVISYGFTPDLALWSPFHSAVYAVVEAVSKIIVSGGSRRSIRLTLQEYFEKLKKESKRWGKPFSSLLGALTAQKNFEIPAIGGKDSMSGTFEHISVPPTLVAIAVCPANITTVISPEFKKVGSTIVYIPLKRKKDYLPDFQMLNKQYDRITELIESKKIISAHSVKTGGIAASVSKMAFGNAIGMKFYESIEITKLFQPVIGSLICEVENSSDITDLFSDVDHILLGRTIKETEIIFGSTSISLSKAIEAWKFPMEKIYPTEVSQEWEDVSITPFLTRGYGKAKNKYVKPRVLIPIFPGTNCEYDTGRVFEKAGARVDNFVFINLTPQKIDESLKELANRIEKSQMIMLPGGFSAGDEPDGSGKFIAAIFRNKWVKNAVNKLIQERDGLILGICNGFQALLKLGLVPFGEIKESDEHFPTLTFNTIGRHVSRMITTKITSVLSPWFSNVKIDEIHTIPVSHGEGRFIACDSLFSTLITQGQIATQYVDDRGGPTMDSNYNPNGSQFAVEGITSPDGRILGKMAHSERIGRNVGINISGNKDQHLFEAGVSYFR